MFHLALLFFLVPLCIQSVLQRKHSLDDLPNELMQQIGQTSGYRSVAALRSSSKNLKSVWPVAKPSESLFRYAEKSFGLNGTRNIFDRIGAIVHQVATWEEKLLGPCLLNTDLEHGLFLARRQLQTRYQPLLPIEVFKLPHLAYNQRVFYIGPVGSMLRDHSKLVINAAKQFLRRNDTELVRKIRTEKTFLDVFVKTILRNIFYDTPLKVRVSRLYKNRKIIEMLREPVFKACFYRQVRLESLIGSYLQYKIPSLRPWPEFHKNIGAARRLCYIPFKEFHLIDINFNTTFLGSAFRDFDKGMKSTEALFEKLKKTPQLFSPPTLARSLRAIWFKNSVDIATDTKTFALHQVLWAPISSLLVYGIIIVLNVLLRNLPTWLTPISMAFKAVLVPFWMQLIGTLIDGMEQLVYYCCGKADHDRILGLLASQEVPLPTPFHRSYQ